MYLLRMPDLPQIKRGFMCTSWRLPDTDVNVPGRLGLYSKTAQSPGLPPTSRTWTKSWPDARFG